MTYISAGRFNGSFPITLARARNGDVIAVQGHGVRPMRWDGVSSYSENAGMDAPLVAPTITKTGSLQYYVARVDVQQRGASYYQPPLITFSGTLAAGGRPAVAKAYLQNAAVSEIRVEDGGRGYTSPPAVNVSGSFSSGASATAIRDSSGGIGNVAMFAGGSGYLVAPEVQFTGGGGSGAAGTATVSGGRVTGVTITDSGSDYTSAPTVTFPAGGAELFPLVRPHFRGSYDCYYRFVDDTEVDRGGPIPSNLSPVTTFDAGDGAGSITWAALNSNAPPRAVKVELWRSTSNQSFTVYRIATVDIGSTFIDSFTDAEIIDPDRAGYAALPIMLPNGELNANRFGVPPSSMAVVVNFQDRFWYGVDTSGDAQNSLLFSEVDEPESVSDVNEIVIQENVRDTDAVTALVPFGASILAMQSRHCYRLTYARQPVIDAAVNLLAYRGCLNQRCWDLHDGVAYVLDQFGVYSITPEGKITPISEGISNYFQVFVDYTHKQWFEVRFDPRARVLRVFLSLRGDNPSESPARILCYSPVMQAWWEERYPRPITAAAGVTMSNGEYRVLYASSKAAIYALDEGWVDVSDGAIAAVNVIDPGAGYLTPPNVTVAGGHGAWIDATLDSNGGVEAMFVRVPGFGYTMSSAVTVGLPDDENHPAPRPARAMVLVYAPDQSVPTPYVYRSSNFEIGTDESEVSKRSPRPSDKSISVVHRPTYCDHDLALRLYYNSSPYPRANVIRRDRGVGFVQDDYEPASIANLRRLTFSRGEATGVQRARFAQVSSMDASGSDRHVAVELSGHRGATGDVVIHQVDIEGVVD